MVHARPRRDKKTSFLVKGLQNNRLKPIVLSHGWINLAPTVFLPKGFLYSLVLSTGSAITITISRKRGGVECSVDKPLNQRETVQLKEILHHMLSLDFPLDEFKALCKTKNDDILLCLARKGWGRMLRSSTVWEDAVKTLCTTNASWPHTQRMCQRMCSCLGKLTPSGYRAFPLPESLLEAGEDFLRDEIRVGYRSRYFLSLAERFVSAQFNWLMSSCPDEAKSEIGSWEGFGAYATKHLLVLLGYHGFLPIDREIGIHLGIRRRGEKKIIRETNHFADWGNFRFTAFKLSRIADRQNWIGG